jgi:hypothetical protein
MCDDAAGMTMQELQQQGKKEIVETEQTLSRAERVVEDTLQIGQQVRSFASRSCEGRRQRLVLNYGQYEAQHQWATKRLLESMCAP